MIKVIAFADSSLPGDLWGYRRMVFSGGEIQVRLDELAYRPSSVTLVADLREANEIIELLLVTDAISQKLGTVGIFGRNYIRLCCPYFPYARQDRVCAPGEAFSVDVMARLINSANYESVEFWDVHSKVSLEKVNRSVNITVDAIIPPSIITGKTVLVSPDKGAIDRVSACAVKFGVPMIIAEKIRDPNDGKILATEVPHTTDEIGVFMRDHICGSRINPAEVDFLMVDDICDGGRTFIELAKVLKPFTNGQIGLWVTHGIFAAGFDVFNGLIDNLYTANCFRNDVPNFVHVGHNL